MKFGSRGLVVDFGELTFRTKDPNAYESELGQFSASSRLYMKLFWD